MKIIIAIIIIIFTNLFGSAEPESSIITNSRTEMLNEATDDEDAAEKMSRIIEYINERDKEGLKSMFSDRALEEAENFDENAELLFDFIEGDIVSFEKSDGQYVSESVDYGEIVREVASFFLVETDRESYSFLINDIPRDDVNEENEGIYMLLVVLKENEMDIYEPENEIIYVDGKKVITPGIYLPIRE